MIVVPIIVLTKLSGANLGATYLKRGNLRRGLSSGTPVLFNFASSAFLFFTARYASVDKLGAAADLFLFIPTLASVWGFKR